MQGMRSRASFLVPTIDVEVVETDTGFLTSEALDTCSSNILFCYSCNTRSYLSPYFLFYGHQPPPYWLRWPGWNPAWLCATFSSVLSGFIGRLGILGRSKYGSLGLGFGPAMIFDRSLGLELVYGSVGRSVPSGDLLVGLKYIRTRL